MFDICAICANQNDKGKCIKPGETCDEAYDFRLKPVYQAAPEMLEVLKGIVEEDFVREFSWQLADKVRAALSKAESKEVEL